MEKISLQKIKWLRSFRIKKNRDESSVFIVEGEKIVSEIIHNYPEKIHFVLSSQELHEQMQLHRFENAFIGSVSDFDKVSNLSTPSKILAVISKFEAKEIQKNKPIIVLDGIQDPGNLGTIIRTADWFGFDQIVCSENTVDFYNTKVIKASMGSIFRVNLKYQNLPNFLKTLKCPIHGALLHGKDLNSLNENEMKVLVLGSEGKGISEDVIPLITDFVSIPGAGRAESLNVGVATGIFLNHWTR